MSTPPGVLLIVDDHLDLAENLAEIFQAAGWQTAVAGTAEQALDRVADGGVVALLTDYRLPGRSGADLMVELRRRGVDIPTVVMSAYSDDATIAEARRAGAAEVLTKPVAIARLLALVATLGELAPPVLVVDDNRPLAENIAEALRNGGFRAAVCTTAAEALAIASRPGVAIIDLRLPDGSGEEVAASLRGRHPRMVVLFVSGHQDELTRSDRRDGGETPFLGKPLDMKRLLQWVAEAHAHAQADSVLIVDDDAALAENVAEILALLDVTVLVADTGARALALAADRVPALALIDVRLPDIDGNQLVARLRAGSPHTEVVLITGDATLDSAIAAVQGGAFAFLLKPVSPQHLLDTARRALDQVALRQERERLQHDLARSERTHREVVEAVPALVLALDAAGTIRVWNRRLEELTGLPRVEMLGRPGEELVGAGGVRPLQTRAGKELLVRWERAEVSAAPGEIATYAVGTDVTAEQEMLRRMLRAERLAAVGTLAAGLAHEVRNPLNSALLQLQVLGRRVDRRDSTPESLRPVLGAVTDELRRLERLVDEFLSFVHPRPLTLQPAALADLCREVLTFITPEAEAARVQVTSVFAEDLPLAGVDPERLRQVLLNLVRNAIEAMPDGGTLTLRSRAGDGAVEIDIEDSGPGFPDETPIFDAFFTTKPKGTGLGLTISHRIVADHGGTMRVRSHPGCTCFTISLPSAALLG